jgi:hypothetical protein
MLNEKKDDTVGLHSNLMKVYIDVDIFRIIGFGVRSLPVEVS